VQFRCRTQFDERTNGLSSTHVRLSRPHLLQHRDCASPAEPQVRYDHVRPTSQCHFDCAGNTAGIADDFQVGLFAEAPDQEAA
jgi:hypothetical protein